MSDTVSYILKSSANQTIGAMRSILGKAAAYAEARKIEEGVLLSARLYPDMHPTTRQVQIACDVAARGTARLASLDIPSFPDTETTIAELTARCSKVLDYVNAADSAKIDASEKVTLEIPMGDNKMPMEGRQYLSSFILPNMHFHAAIFYGLLRTQGLEIGKRDFMMP
jgi:hypothetical protein